MDDIERRSTATASFEYIFISLVSRSLSSVLARFPLDSVTAGSYLATVQVIQSRSLCRDKSFRLPPNTMYGRHRHDKSVRRVSGALHSLLVSLDQGARYLRTIILRSDARLLDSLRLRSSGGRGLVIFLLSGSLGPVRYRGALHINIKSSGQNFVP